MTTEGASTTLSPQAEEAVKQIIEKFREAGVISYQELNNLLPESVAQEDEIDAVLTRLDENGTEIMDETELRARPTTERLPAAEAEPAYE